MREASLDDDRDREYTFMSAPTENSVALTHARCNCVAMSMIANTERLTCRTSPRSESEAATISGEVAVWVPRVRGRPRGGLETEGSLMDWSLDVMSNGGESGSSTARIKVGAELRP